MSEEPDVQSEPEDANTAQPEGQDTTQKPEVEGTPESQDEQQKKFAGIYDSVEALEEGYKNLQPEYTRASQEAAFYRRRVEELEAQGKVSSQPASTAPTEDESLYQQAISEYGVDSMEAKLAKRNLEIGREIAAQKSVVARNMDKDYRTFVGKTLTDNPQIESNQDVKNKFYGDLEIRFKPYGGVKGVEEAIKEGRGTPEFLNFVKESIAASVAFAKPVETAPQRAAADAAASQMAGNMPPAVGGKPTPAPKKRDYFSAREAARLKRT